MCLGVPAKVMSLGEPGNPLLLGSIDIKGEMRPCSFAYLPEAVIGDWVLIQNGFAMNIISEQDAQRSFAAIEEFDLLPEAKKR